MAYEYNLLACVCINGRHRTQRQEKKTSFWLTLIISVYIHSEVQQVCECAYVCFCIHLTSSLYG